MLKCSSNIYNIGISILGIHQLPKFSLHYPNVPSSSPPSKRCISICIRLLSCIYIANFEAYYQNGISSKSRYDGWNLVTGKPLYFIIPTRLSPLLVPIIELPLRLLRLILVTHNNLTLTQTDFYIIISSNFFLKLLELRLFENFRKSKTVIFI